MNFEKETKRDIYFKLLEEENKQLLEEKSGLLSGKYSKKINCPLCSSVDKETLFIRNGYTFVRCRQCTLIYVNPQVDIKLIESFYRKSKANDLWAQISTSPAEMKWKDKYYMDNLALINSLTSNEKGTLLDIGCGMCHFLSLAQKDGWSVEGIELNEKVLKQIKEKFGFNVYETEITKAPIRDNEYDVITMFGVLEHLNDPRKTLGFLGRKLKKQGIILAITPNVYSLYSMILREKSKTFDGKNHLIYFSKQTLYRLFQKQHFEVVSINTILSGMENIARYLQFYDPYETLNNLLPVFDERLKMIFEDKEEFEKILYEYDLGLRLRIVARK